MLQRRAYRPPWATASGVGAYHCRHAGEGFDLAKAGRWMVGEEWRGVGQDARVEVEVEVEVEGVLW